jgi:hypothetical protein
MTDGGIRRSIAAVFALELVATPWLAERFAALKDPTDLDAFTRVALWPWGFVLAAVGVALVIRFALRPGRWLEAAAVLAIAGVLQEGFGHIVGVYFEPFFQTGAVLFGWLAGYGIAAATFGRSGTVRELERVAASGAIAALGAVYVAAGLSKLAASGLAWGTDPTHVRLMILAHREVGASGARDAIIGVVSESGAAGAFFAFCSLIIEVGAFVLIVGSRTRAVWGGLLLAFHAGLYVLTGILFAGGAVLIAAFCLPWHRVPDLPRWSRAAVGAVLVAVGAALVATRSHISELPGPVFVIGAGLVVAATMLPEAQPDGDTTPAAAVDLRRFAIVGGAVLALLAVLWLVPTTPRAHPLDERSPAADAR